MLKKNWPYAVAAFGAYVAAIVLSNWLITHVGIPAGPGTHLTPVGFGLLAPSGVWAAAVSFNLGRLLRYLNTAEIRSFGQVAAWEVFAAGHPDYVSRFTAWQDALSA